MTSPQPSPTPRPGGDPASFLPEALRFLSGEGRARSPEELLDALHDRFRSAGREKLADLVYEMVRSCMASFPDYAQRSYQEVVPRSPEVISGEMGTLNDCLQGVEEAQDLGAVARSTPAAEQALDDAARCLAVLERLEGRSDRHELARALHLVHSGQPLEAEPVLRAFLEPGRRADYVFYARANLAFCLHRADRSAEALPFAKAALEERPEIPTPWFNLISCAAEAGEEATFERALLDFSHLYRSTREPLMRRWLQAEAEVLASQTHLSAAEILRLGGVDDAPSPGEDV